jgi:hypothetical protein
VAVDTGGGSYPVRGGGGGATRLTIRALQKKSAHGESSHDVSNRWVGSQTSVPNLNGRRAAMVSDLTACSRRSKNMTELNSCGKLKKKCRDEVERSRRRLGNPFPPRFRDSNGQRRKPDLVANAVEPSVDLKLRRRTGWSVAG